MGKGLSVQEMVLEQLNFGGEEKRSKWPALPHTIHRNLLKMDHRT